MVHFNQISIITTNCLIDDVNSRVMCSKIQETSRKNKFLIQHHNAVCVEKCSFVAKAKEK